MTRQSVRASRFLGTVVPCGGLVLLTSFTWPLVTMALDGGPVGSVSAARVALSAAALWFISFQHASRRDGPRTSPTSPLKQHDVIMLAASGVAGYTAFSSIAIARMGALVPALIMTTGPVLTMLLESTVSRQHYGAKTWLFGALAVIGAMSFACQSHRLHNGLDAIGLSCAVLALFLIVCYGFHYARLTSAYRGSTARIITPIYVWGVVLFLPWVGWDIMRGDWLTWRAVVPLALVGLVVYPLCYILQHYLFARVGASTVSFVGLGIAPLVAIETGAIGMASFPTWPQWASIALTVAAMYLVIRAKTKDMRTDT